MNYVNIAADASINADDPGYRPDDWGVSTGRDSTVVWRNNDAVTHTVVSDTEYSNPYAGPFDSGLIEPGSTYGYTFFEQGRYSYHCDIHPWMKGIVSVRF